MKDWRKVRVETLAVHAGHEIDPATGAVVAPIHLSTTFERDVEGTYARGFMYTRNDNPNRKALEEGVSSLEGGAAAAAFGSGMAAPMSFCIPPPNILAATAMCSVESLSRNGTTHFFRLSARFNLRPARSPRPLI